MRPAVFLDRDGVINEEIGHLTRADQLRLLPGASDAIKRLNDHDVPVVVVTNQSVVARGLCTEEDVIAVNRALDNLLSADGARIHSYYYCPHHPDAGTGKYLMDCECRKPKPGLLHRAARDMDLDLHRSIIVGDTITDLEAGWRAACSTVLVLTGYGIKTREGMVMAPGRPDHIASDLGDAVDWVIKRLELQSG